MNVFFFFSNMQLYYLFTIQIPHINGFEYAVYILYACVRTLFGA